MKFIALEVSIELVAAIRPVLERLEQRDKWNADQMRRAVHGVPLHLAEGNKRRGKDRPHLFRVADGSAFEGRTALRVAEAAGHLDGLDLTRVNDLQDRQAALIFRLLTPKHA